MDVAIPCKHVYRDVAARALCRLADAPRRARPTLAEYLGDRGYATAGFVANTGYCAADSGLARGFTRYHDFIFPDLTVLKTAILVNRGLEGLRMVVYFWKIGWNLPGCSRM